MSTRHLNVGRWSSERRRCLNAWSLFGLWRKDKNSSFPAMMTLYQRKWTFFTMMVLFSLKLNVSFGEELNGRPVIGLLAQRSFKSGLKYGKSYISASYVKYLESAGGRVVPILVNQTDQYYEDLFNSINGILFPGGGADLDAPTIGYAGAAKKLFDLAITANKAGDFFPLWGTCLGFEELMIRAAGEDLLRGGINSTGTSPLDLVPGYEKSRLLNGSTTPASVIKAMTEENSTYNHHNKALTKTNFTKSAALKSFYRVLSTNLDANGVEFISMVEAYDYPVYGTQWHPEKNAFEWKVNACHTISCVQLMQYVANFFVQEARRSMHHFSSKEEEAKHLIYNYQPIDLSQTTSLFEQAYFFD